MRAVVNTGFALLFALMTLCCSEGEKASRAGAVEVLEETSAPVTASAGAGAIRGGVFFAGEAPRPQKLLVVKDVDVCGQREHYDERLLVGKDNGLPNTVVFLTGVSTREFPASWPPAILTQKGCRYEPHVLLAPAGSPVQILNEDGILHNIHTFSRANPPMNLAQPKFKPVLEVTFDSPEKVPAKCDVHGWMSAWIVVTDHPYYAVTDGQGRFSLRDVPSGEYTLNCWQEALGEQSQPVTVLAGQELGVEFAYEPK